MVSANQAIGGFLLIVEAPAMVVELVDYSGIFQAKGIAKRSVQTLGSGQRKPLNINVTKFDPTGACISLPMPTSPDGREWGRDGDRATTPQSSIRPALQNVHPVIQ